MDGTLLDSNKQIRQDSLDAIERAAKAGKIVGLSTGRNPAEIAEHRFLMPSLKYIMGTNGGLIIDNQTDEIVFHKPFENETVIKMLEISRGFDVLPHMHSKGSNFQRRDIVKMADYGMGAYRPMFERVCTLFDDMLEEYKADPFPVYKIGFFCHTPQIRTELEAALSGMGITMCYSETKSLECTPLGVSKASGLEIMCRIAGIDISESIAVGDGDNDLEILKAAGLGVAMGNANERVKAIAGAVVADCDSGGIAQVIDEFLLK